MNTTPPGVANYHQDTINYFENVIRRSLLNRAYSSAGLVIGTSSTAAVKIANTVTYTVNGVFCSKTTAEVAFTTAANIPANAASVQEQLFLLTLDASGNATLTGGGISTGAGTALYPELPALPNTVIGGVRIAVAAGSTSFVGGTTALSNGALTVTYYNLTDLVPSANAAQ